MGVEMTRRCMSADAQTWSNFDRLQQAFAPLTTNGSATFRELVRIMTWLVFTQGILAGFLSHCKGLRSITAYADDLPVRSEARVGAASPQELRCSRLRTTTYQGVVAGPGMGRLSAYAYNTSFSNLRPMFAGAQA